MTTLTIELDDSTAEAIRRLAADQSRPESDLLREAVLQYLNHGGRPHAKGIGEYHSGRSDVSESHEDILRDAAEKGEWP